MKYEVWGVDPGLVDTGIVQISFDTDTQRWYVNHTVFKGVVDTQRKRRIPSIEIANYLNAEVPSHAVIYGLGSAFDGNLRRRDLEADTPWNTYTRGGLPPTPIALPGRAAIEAAVHPAPGKALYFVARGDGSHEFSDSLEAHNRAVARYQLHR